MTGLPLRKPYDGCPLCGGQPSTFLRTVDISGHKNWSPGLPAKMTWVKCDSCDHVFTSDYWTDEGFDALFSKNSAIHQPGAELEERRFAAGRTVLRVIDNLPQPLPHGAVDLGRWLDVGCGNGALLFTAQEFGFEPVGLDVRLDTVEAMNAMGVEAHHRIIEWFSAEYTFKVVSLCDVIEHLVYPKDALKAARRLVAEDGVLLIATPNMGTALWRLLDLQGGNPYWHEIEHFHCFTRKRLYALLEECGFVPMSYAVSERYRVGMEAICRVAS